MKVVCISSQWDEKDPGNIVPVKDSVYTVVGCMMFENKPGYLLKEIPEIQQKHRVYWDCEAFIPLTGYKQEELKNELKEIFKEVNV